MTMAWSVLMTDVGGLGLGGGVGDPGPGDGVGAPGLTSQSSWSERRGTEGVNVDGAEDDALSA